MKTSILSVFCAIVMTATVGCGLQEGDTSSDCTADCGDGGAPPSTDGGGTVTPPDAGQPEYLPAPFRSQGPYVMDFSIAYVSGSLCGELRGNLPGMTWEHGPAVADLDAVTGEYDGYLGTAFEIPAGTYDVTYVDSACPGEVAQSGNWADYGNLRLQVLNMRPEDRAFLFCTQYDAETDSCSAVSDPGCKIRLSVDSSGNITPAGNMRDLTESATGCW